MWRARAILLLIIAAILGAVAAAYYFQKRALARQAPPPPKSLPLHVDAAAQDWRWSQTREGRPVVEVRARRFRQIKEPSHFQLEHVEVQLYKSDARSYDLVSSAQAQFDLAARKLYSEGEVQIVLGLPASGAAREKPVTIRSSGVTFESDTGKASTERAAAFEFRNGTGSSVGAAYDPNSRELHLRSRAELNWLPAAPGGKPMKVEAGEMIYKEAIGQVLLFPWAKLTRANSVIEAADTLVLLERGDIRTIEAQRARGTDRYPSRELDYAADHLTVKFAAEGEVESVLGAGNARLVSVSSGARTTVTTDRVDLTFRPGTDESALEKAVATGRSTVESRPIPQRGADDAPPARVLRAEVIHLLMRPDGREIESVQTHTPGHIEFLPGRPGQRYRRIDGERMWMRYGPENRLESFTAVEVSTRSDPEARPGRPAGAPALTRSKGLQAEFDRRTGELSRIEQIENFEYEEGPRRAKADRAIFEQAANRITLDGRARLWDGDGSAAANRIVLDQASGDTSALGNVISTRQPEKRPGRSSSTMLSSDEPLQARAARMITSHGNRNVLYEGDAAVWQGASRIRAHTIEIDRQQRTLVARGNVVSQFVDRPREGPAGKPRRSPEFVVVEAGQLVYSEQNRLAHYSGGARLNRQGMEVKASEIRAYLREPGGESSLDKAVADGGVQIVQAAAGRTRNGSAEHAEYFVAEEKIVLEGGEPAFSDTLRGATRGRQLTYYARNDRLLVNGVESRPAVSRIPRAPAAQGGAARQ